MSANWRRLECIDPHRTRVGSGDFAMEGQVHARLPCSGIAHLHARLGESRLCFLVSRVRCLGWAMWWCCANGHSKSDTPEGLWMGCRSPGVARRASRGKYSGYRPAKELSICTKSFIIILSPTCFFLMTPCTSLCPPRIGNCYSMEGFEDRNDGCVVWAYYIDVTLEQVTP